MSRGSSESHSSVFFERSKLLIMTRLAMAKGGVSFSELQAEVELTKGNLSFHLRKLEELKLIRVKKGFVDRKPRTTIEITDTGKAEFKNHLSNLKSILKGVKL